MMLLLDNFSFTLGLRGDDRVALSHTWACTSYTTIYDEQHPILKLVFHGRLPCSIYCEQSEVKLLRKESLCCLHSLLNHNN